jgi:hypothetical protein
VYHPAAAALLKIDRPATESPGEPQRRLPQTVRHRGGFGVLTGAQQRVSAGDDR